MTRRRLVILAARGSGGAITHLRQVIPRIVAGRPDWKVELYAPPPLLEHAFGTASEPWMRHTQGGSYRARLVWELYQLTMLARDPDTLVYSPFGPHLNLAAASRTVWSARNIIPLLDPSEWEVSPNERPRLQALRQLFRASARLSRRTICVSHNAKKRLVSLSGARPESIAVIPHGADAAVDTVGLESTLPADLRDRGFVLSVGQPTPYRRTRELIDAYASIARRREVPPLVIIGEVRAIDDEYGRACAAAAAPFLEDGRIRLLGQRPPAETLWMTASASVITYPSVHEDCPNAILEALSAGKPIVCADIPATRELAEGAALLVPDPRAFSIAQALERVLFDRALSASLAAAALERARRFTWGATAAATLAVLDQAFSTRKPRAAA